MQRASSAEIFIASLHQQEITDEANADEDENLSARRQIDRDGRKIITGTISSNRIEKCLPSDKTKRSTNDCQYKMIYLFVVGMTILL